MFLVASCNMLPMLIFDKRLVGHATAICRFVARQYDLAGKTDLASLHIDSVVDTIHDIRYIIAEFYYEKDEKYKAKKRAAAEKTLPPILESLDQDVKKNDGYFRDGTLSWADLTFVALLDYFNFMYKSNLIENYENLKLLEKRVLRLPTIRDWFERRPVSEY
ncbi:glutathione S-transferase [Bombus impatiens]|uniref:glutathione transferase n=1 Tax=Bombus impatiens TaxID=132113 RepID=A0A6P8M0A4_BOMIM|nr:glutathione S-transferase [Bombus impatiens]